MGQQLKDIVTPHQHDVLCGRGGGTNNHVGNELFRQMVNQKKRSYLNSCKRDKPAVSRAIVQAIRTLDPPGRFLQRDEGTGLWFDIGDQKAREKTSQALREGAPEIRKSMGSNSSNGNGNGHTGANSSQDPSPAPPNLPWHGGHPIPPHPGQFPPHHDPFFAGGPPGKLSADARGRSSASVSNGSGGFTPPRTSSFAAGVPPLGHYYGGPAIPPPFDPYGRQYSFTAAGAAAAAAAAAGSARGLLHDYSASARPSISLPSGNGPHARPDSGASAHPSHITPEAAKALMQFLKAQQAKAETDPHAASTFVESRDLATAIAAAAATGNKEAPPSPGRVSAIAAELEALAQVRSQPRSQPEPTRAASSLAPHSDLALSIASVAGISPAAATLALQLASKAKEIDTTAGSTVRPPEAAQRASLPSSFSSGRSSFYNTSAATANDPHAASKRSSTLDIALGDILSRRAATNAALGAKLNEGGKAKEDNQSNEHGDSLAMTSRKSLSGFQGTSNAATASVTSLTPEVERRLAVAEHMADLARAGARDRHSAKSAARKSDTLHGEFDDADEAELPITRKDREYTLLRKRSALFQDLGILGVKLETIQSAIADGKSLYHLVEEARKRPRTVENIRVEDLRPSNLDVEESNDDEKLEITSKIEKSESKGVGLSGTDSELKGSVAPVASSGTVAVKDEDEESQKSEAARRPSSGASANKCTPGDMNGLNSKTESSKPKSKLGEKTGLSDKTRKRDETRDAVLSPRQQAGTFAQKRKNDAVFTKDMVQSALDAIGANITVS